MSSIRNLFAFMTLVDKSESVIPYPFKFNSNRFKVFSGVGGNCLLNPGCPDSSFNVPSWFATILSDLGK